jgi:hypothetical protein
MKRIVLFLIIFTNNILLSQSNIHDIQTTISGLTIKGQYKVYFKENNGDTKKITKPFIICEGYDPLNNQKYLKQNLRG